MKRLMKQIIKKTPLYHPLRNWVIRRRQIAEIAEWEGKGKPIGPPPLPKQRVLREYAKKYGLRILVETGTLFGDMVEAMRVDFDQIYSIELSKELYEQVRKRFKGVNHIELICGDSGIELRNIMGNGSTCLILA